MNAPFLNYNHTTAPSAGHWLACWNPEELITIAADLCPYQVDPGAHFDPDRMYCQAPTDGRIWCAEHERQLADWYPDQYGHLARVTLESCICSKHFDCPDGWHWGNDLPCSCTPDCALEDEDKHHPESCSGSGHPAADHARSRCPECGYLVDTIRDDIGGAVLEDHPADQPSPP